MLRSTWKGFIRLSLVSLPVRAYTASASGGGELHLNQLHEKCHSRIRYLKVCPIHGEVPNEEIVKGYEYAKGQYAIIDLHEIEKLRSEADRSINIDMFIRPGALDPIYYSGKSYYLAPDGPAGLKPYVLLRQAMQEEDVCGVATVVLSGKEELVLLRPVEDLLAIDSLAYQSQVKAPGVFADEVGQAEFTSKELDLTRSLIEATTTEEFDYSQYKDVYTQRLAKLIEAKVQGKEIVAAPEETPPQVINLMDALKASVEQARKSKKSPTPKTAPSQRQRKPGRKKRTG
jgi:DNA end-binding protein Ku